MAETTLAKDDIERLLKGASLLATGGGLCYEDQIKSLQKHGEISVTLKSLNDFDGSDLLVTAAEVGPASAAEIDKRKILPAMIDAWERLTSQKIAGVYPPEIGQEMILIDTALALNVPVADFDPAGGRAVPLIDISSLVLADIDVSFAPMVLATDRGEIIAVDTPIPPHRAEEFLRTMSALSREHIVYFIGAGIPAKALQGKGIDNGSLSLALKIGSASDINSLKETLRATLTIAGRVTEKTEINRDGFNCFTALFEDDGGRTYTLSILNEILFIRDEKGAMVAAAPDKILLVDEETMSGVPTAALLSGRRVTLMLVGADPFWRSERAQKLFGPERFPFLLSEAA